MSFLFFYFFFSFFHRKRRKIIPEKILFFSSQAKAGRLNGICSLFFRLFLFMCPVQVCVNRFRSSEQKNLNPKQKKKKNEKNSRVWENARKLFSNIPYIDFSTYMYKRTMCLFIVWIDDEIRANVFEFCLFFSLFPLQNAFLSHSKWYEPCARIEPTLKKKNWILFFFFILFLLVHKMINERKKKN